MECSRECSTAKKEQLTAWNGTGVRIQVLPSLCSLGNLELALEKVLWMNSFSMDCLYHTLYKTLGGAQLYQLETIYFQAILRLVYNVRTCLHLGLSRYETFSSSK